jgi:hypothetical protein
MREINPHKPGTTPLWYGRCPQCNAPGVSCGERDAVRCSNGHEYEIKTARWPKTEGQNTFRFRGSLYERLEGGL